MQCVGTRLVFHISSIQVLAAPLPSQLTVDVPGKSSSRCSKGLGSCWPCVRPKKSSKLWLWPLPHLLDRLEDFFFFIVTLPLKSIKEIFANMRSKNCRCIQKERIGKFVSISALCEKRIRDYLVNR